MASMLILSHADVRAALSPEACERAMREVLAGHAQGATYLPLRSVMAPPGAAGLMGLMPAWGPAVDGRAAEFALKVVCVMRDNPGRGLDAHQGFVALFDGETGVPEAILDASAVTQIRTAAVTAVATDLLARAGARVLAILGAGVQASAHVRALRGTREFTEIRAYSPTAAHVRALVGVTACASAEEAVRDADVVVTATNSRTPVLRHEWLGPGVHLNAIGASIPSAYEIEPETFAEAVVFADSRESVRAEAGEYRLAVERGLIDGERHIRAELGELLAGSQRGRAREDELTLFRSLGIAVEDLAAARCAVDTARELRIGTEVEL